MARRTLKWLDPREYEHPFDRRALDALEKARLLVTMVKGRRARLHLDEQLRAMDVLRLHEEKPQ